MVNDMISNLKARSAVIDPVGFSAIVYAKDIVPSDQ